MSVTSGTTYIEIKWKNRSFMNDPAVHPTTTCLQSLDTVKQFKIEVSGQIGIPIDYIQVFYNNSELKDNQKMKDFTRQTIEIVTDATRKLQSKQKFRLVNIINPSSITEIELEEDETKVHHLKKHLLDKEKIFLKENEYIAIYFWDKGGDKATEIFDMHDVEQYHKRPLQPLHYLVKQMTNDVAEQIGRATISVTIVLNEKKTVIRINQQQTFNDLKNIIARELNFRKDKFKLICGTVDYTKDYDHKTLYKEGIINNVSFNVIPLV